MAEFDLAFKAFDSYVEIVQRGKDREEKSGEPDYSLDNDDTVLHTASEAIRILCRFGSLKEAEKARDICLKVEEWLARAINDPNPTKAVETLPVRVPVSPTVISEAYCALGICEAHWARLTYDAPSRNNHQQKAVDNFRIALDPQYGNSNNLETKYALALLLAEMRELSPAIKIVKQALAQKPTKSDTYTSFSSNGYSPDEEESDSVDFARERKLIPFWHLLSLLLTAKSDLVTAVRSSNAAFEQFDDLTNLFGNAKEFRSEHLNEEKGKRLPRALIDKMERFEKEGIIQVRITQIALMETLESPMEAIDATAELLALYARLFGDPKTEILKAHSRATTAKPPKTSMGIRHSILSRARSRRRDDKPMPMTSITVPALPSVASTRPSTMATSTTAAPTIQITNEDGTAPRGRTRNGNRHSLFRSKSQHSGQATPRSSSRKLQKRSRSNSRTTPDLHQPSITVENATLYETINEKEKTALDEHFGEQPSSMLESFNEQDDNIHESINEKRSPPRETFDEKRATPNGYPDIGAEDRITVSSPPRPSTSHSDKKSTHKEPLERKSFNQDSLDKKLSFDRKSFGSPHQSIHKSPVNYPLPEEQSPADQPQSSPTKSDTHFSTPYPTTGNSTPEPVFPSPQERRHKISLLVELWLFIAELYIRGSVYDDAKGAIDEAAELVQVLEMEVSLESSSVKAFGSKGWGGGKSVEELWGDVFARVSSHQFHSPESIATLLIQKKIERQTCAIKLPSLRSNSLLRKSPVPLSRSRPRHRWHLRTSPRHLHGKDRTRTTGTTHLHKYNTESLFLIPLRSPFLNDKTKNFSRTRQRRF
jgi:tetratricopeptide (TPR) repeat protein